MTVEWKSFCISTFIFILGLFLCFFFRRLTVILVFLSVVLLHVLDFWFVAFVIICLFCNSQSNLIRYHIQLTNFCVFKSVKKISCQGNVPLELEYRIPALSNVQVRCVWSNLSYTVDSCFPTHILCSTFTLKLFHLNWFSKLSH